MIQSKSYSDPEKGCIVEIDGPIIGVRYLKNQQIGDLVKIGKNELIGEIIKIKDDKSVVQCYDFTEGLTLYEDVHNTGKKISMELGPGLLNTIFDGIQRPLRKIADQQGSFILHTKALKSLSRETKYHFKPLLKKGDAVFSGYIVGEVNETKIIKHKILVDMGISGTIESIVEEGDYSIEEVIYSINTDDNIQSYNMIKIQPIREPRPYLSRLKSNIPLITGLRIYDLLLPLSKGGTAALPGGFGTGKTITLHSLSKWSDADVIVYIQCGERGIELAQVLKEFPEIELDSKGCSIMERTIIIGHPSNMPVSARETSIFSGLTIAEYYRDMGYDVAILVDSISRWVESLREVSSRLEEMPAAGGYPAYMSKKLADFFERSGYVQNYGAPSRTGSISIIGTISPPAGDLSEPVTKTVKRYARAFWVLDSKLSYARHYPAVNLSDSYSLYSQNLVDWWEKMEPGWVEARKKVVSIFSKSMELENVVMLVGTDNLPRDQQLILFAKDLITDTYLEQNAFNEVDRYSSPKKTMKFIKLILKFYDIASEVIQQDVPLFVIKQLPIVNKLKRLKYNVKNDETDKISQYESEIFEQIKKLALKY